MIVSFQELTFGLCHKLSRKNLRRAVIEITTIVPARGLIDVPPAD